MPANSPLSSSAPAKVTARTGRPGPPRRGAVPPTPAAASRASPCASQGAQIRPAPRFARSLHQQVRGGWPRSVPPAAHTTRSPDGAGLDLLRLFLFEVGAKDVGEEVVVAVPLAPVVERDDQEVGSLKPLQHGLATGGSGDGVAEGPTEPVKNACANEKASDLVGLSGEYFVDQIIDDVAVVTGETGDEAGDVVEVPASKALLAAGRRSSPPYGFRVHQRPQAIGRDP